MRFSLLLSAAVICLFSQQAGAESLTDAVVAALNRHPSVQSALAERNVAKAQEDEKYSDYFPQLNANAAAGRVYGDNSTSRGLTIDRGAGYSYDGEGSLSIKETIFDGMQTQNHVAAARNRVASASDTLVDVRENLALRVVLAYLDVMRTRESGALIRDHAKKIATYRTRIGKMVEDGGADQSMAVQAHDIENQMDGTLVDVDGQMNKALAEYAEAAGHVAEEPLQKPEMPQGLADDVEKAVQAARESHPALRAARLQRQAAAHDTQAEKGTLYPDLTSELSYYKKDVRDVIGGEVVDARALLRMNWDFSTGGAQLARIRQGREKQVQADAQIDDLAGRIEREIRKAYAELDASKKRLDVSRDRVQVSRDLVSTYEKQFEGAKVSLLNLLQAENTDFNARLALVNADYRYQAAAYSALANTGRLQEALGIKPMRPATPAMAENGQ